MTPAQAEELLKAGAVLPPGTDAGERAVPLVARAYRHPGLDDRVVVRLVPEELGAAEDLAAGFMGLEPDGEPVVVGLGARRSLGFPEWVLAHHPQDGRHALGVMPELERIARQARSKPKQALDAYQRLAREMAASVPHFLPTFYEQAGRVFLDVENPAYAAQMFGAARRAEAEHGLEVDEDRLDAVFLEFALAGALPVKVLSAYAKELAARVPAEEALRRFARLCVRRTAGGLPPSAQMAADLRRLARACGADADAEEQAYLGELLGLPVTQRAATGWWKAHGAAIAALARREPRVRGALLNMMPQSRDSELAAVWLDLLDRSGATAGLIDPGAPEEERPADGSSGWLARFLTARNYAWGLPARLPRLYDLVERMAGALRAEPAEGGVPMSLIGNDVDLVDLLLALGVPVAAPGPRDWLRLEHWATGEGRRDLLALGADERFKPVFHRACDGLDGDESGIRAVRVLAGSPGGRPLLAEWVAEVARRFTTTGLPDMPEAMRRLAWLPGEALALAADEVRRAAATDVAPVLARTLRAGLLDELGWPAWDDAAAALVPVQDVDDIIVADAWPHLIAAGPAQVRVLGAEGTVLTHDLRIPSGDLWGRPGFHHVGGELLVYWRSRALDDGLRGYWHTSPSTLHPIEGRDVRGLQLDWYHGDDAVTLPLPGGGRTTGHLPLNAGDTVLPEELPVMSDGAAYWVRIYDRSEPGGAWHEFDPASGRHGRRSLPGFLADALRAAPAGSELVTGWLLPAPSAEPTAFAVPAGGLYGWRVVRLPDGAQRGEDLAGRAVTVPPGAPSPVGALTLPGGEDRPLAVVRTGAYRISLIDADGIVTTTVKTDAAPGPFAEGTLILPPPHYWHCLRPRDPRGSAALRRADRDLAAALLDAALGAADGETGAEDDELRARVRALLPEVTDDALATGIAGVVRFAAAQRARLQEVGTRLSEALDGGPQEDSTPAGPTDRRVEEALTGLGWFGGFRWHHTEHDGAWRQIRALARAVAGELPPGPADRLHGYALPGSTLQWDLLLDTPAALAYRTAVAPTTPDHRTALAGLLGALDGAGLLGPAQGSPWRLMSLNLAKRHLIAPGGGRSEGHWLGVLPLDGGGFLALVRRGHLGDDGCDFTALCHDPSGRFEVPAPYTVKSQAPAGGEREAGWAAAFLAELAERGPAPWRPEAAEEFAALTGVSPTLARLVVAGMPNIDAYQHSFLDKDVRTLLGVKAADAALAKEELRRVPAEVRRAVVAALLPADPAGLWTAGPDAARAAEVWNAALGRRRAIPEWLASEAARSVRTGWDTGRTVQALLDPAATPELSRDLTWTIRGDRAQPEREDEAGFSAEALVSVVAMAGWLAHRLPAGDPIRAALPGALAAVRERLAAPGLLLDLGRYVSLPAFRKAAGAPTETGQGYERYGAVVMATYDERPAPAVRVAEAGPSGDDPYLRALIATEGAFPAVTALRMALDPGFAALLADPGGPAAGERDADGAWWPQDPTRSVPDLVAEAAKEHGLSEDAAAVYLMLLAMPDPTDRNTARWTGWKPARLKAARAELAATSLVVEAGRSRAGRSLFLPGGWEESRSPRLPLETWKLPMFGDAENAFPLVPQEPAAALYARAWRRVREGDAPRFEELKARRGRRR